MYKPQQYAKMSIRQLTDLRFVAVRSGWPQ